MDIPSSFDYVLFDWFWDQIVNIHLIKEKSKEF